MKPCLLTGMLLFFLQGNAQADLTAQKKKALYQVLVQGGLFKGANGTGWQLQLVNGIQYKTWFAGAGTGIDQYAVRTVPLFASVRKDLLQKGSTLFLYINAGGQVVWPRERDKISSNQHFGGGIYYDAGAGYKLGLNRTALLFKAGYTLKKFRYTLNYPAYCIVAPCLESRNETVYTARRISFSLGFIF